MKKGDKIVCINNLNVNWLNIGEIYQISGIDEYIDNPNIIDITKNSIGEHPCVPVNKSRFITLKEYRRLKLEKFK